MEYIAAFIGCFGMAALMVLINPDFWQGFRNSKFLDKLKEEQDEQKRHEQEVHDRGNELPDKGA